MTKRKPPYHGTFLGTEDDITLFILFLKDCQSKTCTLPKHGALTNAVKPMINSHLGLPVAYLITGDTTPWQFNAVHQL